jgi:hypothetical protein
VPTSVTTPDDETARSGGGVAWFKIIVNVVPTAGGVLNVPEVVSVVAVLETIG